VKDTGGPSWMRFSQIITAPFKTSQNTAALSTGDRTELVPAANPRTPAQENWLGMKKDAPPHLRQPREDQGADKEEETEEVMTITEVAVEEVEVAQETKGTSITMDCPKECCRFNRGIRAVEAGEMQAGAEEVETLARHKTLQPTEMVYPMLKNGPLTAKSTPAPCQCGMGWT
ncbi:hypothetical protein DXG01_003262, partial [Tephrocybe rancida]